MKKIKDAIGLGLQLAYEYPGWGWEHISDMLATYERPSKAPCDGDELYDLANEATAHKTAGLSFEDAQKAMLEKHTVKKKNKQIWVG